MTEYLGMLVAVGAVVAFCELISYGGVCDKTVKGALGVVLLCCLVVPVGRAALELEQLDIDGVIDLPDAGGQIEDTLYYKTAEEYFCIGIERHLDEELQIDGDDVAVRTEGFDIRKMKAEKIIIVLSGDGAYADYRAVRALINASGLGECEVKLEFD